MSKFLPALIALMLSPFRLWAAPAQDAMVLKLGMEDYVRLTLKQGDDARVAFNSFANSRISRRVNKLQLFAPSFEVDSDVSKQKTEVDADFDIEESAEASATVSQPLFLSGGRLSASYSNSISRSEDEDGDVDHSYERPAWSATFRQPLFLFVGNSDLRSWTRSRISFENATDNYRRQIQSIDNRARARYYDLLLKAAQLEVERTKSVASRRSHEITKALVNGGRLPGIELARSNLRLQQDVRRQKNAETALQQAINNALELASLSLDYRVELTSKLTYVGTPLELEPLIDFALKNRPDYLSAKRSIELTRIDVRETFEENNPSLNAVASVTRRETGDGNPPDTERKSWSGGLTLRWPIFDSGITRLRGEAAETSLEIDLVQLRAFERNIRTEVTNAFLDLKRTEQQLDDLQSSKEQARKSVEAVRIRYQNGRDRLLDVFDSEQQLRDLELEQLNVIVAANLARDRLNFLIGKSTDMVPQ